MNSDIITDLKNPARGHKVENHHPGEKMYDVLSIHEEKGNDTKILGKNDISKERRKRKKQKRKKDADNSSGEELKENKTNETSEKDNTAFAWRIQVRATCG